MATHVIHPDAHEHGLADKCPRCAEIADEPVAYMYEELLYSTWRRMVSVEWGVEAYRSSTEARAGKKLYAFAVFLERYTDINPKTFGEVVPA